MKLLMPLALLLATASAPVDRSPTFLASIVGVPLGPGESMVSFSISTWGVGFNAICKIPPGWRIKAGSSATPNGILEGEGSQGATWFNRRSPVALRNLVLISLYGPVQPDDVRNGPDATFKGEATISTEEGERKAALTYRNVRLIRAAKCA